MWTYLSTTQEAHDDVAAAFQNELGRPATDQNIADMQHLLAASNGSLDNVHAYVAGTQEAATDITDLYEYGLGRAPTAPELSSAQATLAKDGSLRDTYQSLSGIAGAGLVGNADQFSAVLRQAHLLDAGTPGAPSVAARAFQGVLSWAASNAPKLTAGGVAGAILLTPLNSQQVTTDVGVTDHPELGARFQRAPGSATGTVTLYMRGPDAQPTGDGLTLNRDVYGQLTGPPGTPIAGLLFGTLPTDGSSGNVQLAPELDVTLAGQQAPIGYSSELRTQEESNLVASLRAQGTGVQEIQTALDNLRSERGGATDPGYPLTVTGQVLPTPKDGVVGGLPTGTPPDATRGDPGTRRGLQRENEAAITLAATGYRVEQSPTRRPGDTFAPNENPDLRIGENIFDVYSPSTNDLDNIRNTISGKTKGHTNRIVINLADSAVTPDQVRDVLARKPTTGLYEALAIDQQGHIVQLFPNIISGR